MKKLILFSGFLMGAVLTSAQTEVTTGVTRGKDFGVTYVLPKTQIDIEVKANKIIYTPGEFSKYADRYLRLNNVSADAQEYWELVSVKAKSVGVPDSERVYFVKMKDKTVAPLIELTEDGIIKSINTPFSPRKATPAAVLTPAKKRVNPRDFLTEEILMANSSAKMAELVAKEIYNIRESKNALVRGQADNMPKDGEQLKLMLNSLDEQEGAMTEMFSGTSDKEEKTFTIRIDPSKELKDQIAFRFSKKLGVVANNDLAGEPVYISLKDVKAINLPPEDGKKKVDGIAYIVPGKALVTLTEGKNKLFEEELPVTQFGSIEFLAPALFNKKATTKVSFNPVTGGLIKVDREEGN
ncbi:DUF4831 family protein [Bacteroides sp.]|uniref:DUF4831 family protein n=1 Tax=Bacteroides sp. TaxID=29523 RepID=UPI001B6FA7E4|nr:DUF4831 family protein [Bacteroides sp.]MBP6064894.1 DUF4831 family protein [Bacteroides sp.]MBP6067374.1 DUF4831 family protein [Bacteroides sp.]MBP6935643.1 DUF4831 family protein [Bacteroides sp.]MBP8621497.1 DUF4831 family protein [Bacteroides sp.]MBP9508187.1 DUF4831 family protein [Bacteroides sp.]